MSALPEMFSASQAPKRQYSAAGCAELEMLAGCMQVVCSLGTVGSLRGSRCSRRFVPCAAGSDVPPAFSGSTSHWPPGHTCCQCCAVPCPAPKWATLRTTSPAGRVLEGCAGTHLALAPAGRMREGVAVPALGKGCTAGRRAHHLPGMPTTRSGVVQIAGPQQQPGGPPGQPKLRCSPPGQPALRCSQMQQNRLEAKP